MVSVALNIGLAAAFLAWKAPTSQPAAAAKPAAGGVRAAFLEARPTRAASVVITNQFNWAALESKDYRQYIANLRAVGCPEQTIRDIIIADVSKLYGERMAALNRPKDFKFWEAENFKTRQAEEARDDQVEKLNSEKRALLKELLDVDLDAEVAKWEGEPVRDERTEGFLPPEKKKQVEALLAKFQEQQDALLEGGEHGAGLRTKTAALQAQLDAALRQMLTPQEYDLYQLHNSPTAENMRDSLGAFEPTEQEFRDIFKVRKALDDQYSEGPADAAAREAKAQAQKQTDEQIHALLGDERYRQYVLAQDGRFSAIYDFAQENNLPRQTAEAVYDLRKAADEARQNVLADPALAPDQRAAALQAIADEARRSVIGTLGEVVFNDYLQRGGNWVNTLSILPKNGKTINSAAAQNGVPGASSGPSRTGN